MTTTEWGQLLLLSVLWGGSYLFVALAVRDFPPLTLIALRLSTAVVLLGALLWFQKQRLPRDPRLWVDFFIMGAFNNALPFWLIATAQTWVGGGLASIINSSTPLWTALIAHVLTRDEKLTGTKLAGVVVGLAGVATMIGVDALRSLGADVVPQLACVAAAMCFAVATVFGRRLRNNGLPFNTTTTCTTLAAAALAAPAALLVDQPWTLAAPGLPAIGAIFGLAAFSTASGYLIYYRLLATAGALNCSLVTFLIPVSAILLGLLLLSETLGAQHLAGMLTIFVGLALIDGRPGGWIRSRMGR